MIKFQIPNFKNFLFLFFGLWFLVIGCEYVDKESLDKIIQEDPLFRDILVKKQELDSKIDALLTQLREAKGKADASIRAIQEDFDKQRKEIDSRINGLKKELEPQRMKIRQELETLRITISTKKAVLRDLENTRRNLTNLINQQKAVNVTSEDMTKWQERLAALNSQIDPLIGEIRELEEETHSLRLKLIVLRQ